MKNIFLTWVLIIVLAPCANGKEKIKGGIDPDVIRKVLIDHIPHMRNCYQKQLNLSKKKFGFKAKLSFSIDKEGKTQKVNVIEEVKEGKREILKNISNCVAILVKKITFTKPVGGGNVEVSQPINFYPRNE